MAGRTRQTRGCGGQPVRQENRRAGVAHRVQGLPYLLPLATSALWRAGRFDNERQSKLTGLSDRHGPLRIAQTRWHCIEISAENDASAGKLAEPLEDSEGSPV